MTRSGAGDARRFFSVPEAAEMLGVSDMTLYRAINAKAFPALRLRGRLIIPAKAIDQITDAALANGGVVDTADFVAPGGAA